MKVLDWLNNAENQLLPIFFSSFKCRRASLHAARPRSLRNLRMPFRVPCHPTSCSLPRLMPRHVFKAAPGVRGVLCAARQMRAGV